MIGALVRQGNLTLSLRSNMTYSRWPELDARLRGTRVAGLRYEPDSGFVVVEFVDGGELRISADWEGCARIVLEMGAGNANRRTLLYSYFSSSAWKRGCERKDSSRGSRERPRIDHLPGFDRYRSRWSIAASFSPTIA